MCINGIMDSTEITKQLLELNLKLDDMPDEGLAKAFTVLLQIIEKIQGENEKLKDEIRYLKQRLKMESDDSDSDTTNKKKPHNDHSSEDDRKEPTPKGKKKRGSKKDRVHIDRTKYCEVDKTILPEDAKFIGYQDIIIQEIVIKTDNILYKKEIYYSKLEKKTYIASLPSGVQGEFGPGLRSLVFIMKHVCNMSEPKITEFFDNFGIYISQSTVSRILTKGRDIDIFHEEKEEIFKAGLNSTTYQGIDATGAIVNGKNHHVQIICNQYYTSYFTCEHKNRLSIIDILLCGNPRRYYLNEEALGLLEIFRVSKKVMSGIRDEAFEKILDEEQMQLLLAGLFADPDKGKNSRLRIMEAGAIAYYHNQSEIPIVRILLSDNAPEYKMIAEYHALCWIHDGRSYKKLNPVVPLHQEELNHFLTHYWDYYQNLLDYKNDPDPVKKEELSLEFDEIFSTQTNYPALNDRIQKTKAKKSGMLLVLEFPEIELHNNAAELGARAQARKRDVSLHTITEEGTKSQDTCLTITQTAKKAGLRAYNYIFDRISGKFELPALASMIPQQIHLHDTS